MGSLRLQVLQSFKNLHRTRIKVFANDERTLLAGRLKINEEFKKNKNVTDEVAIKTMIKFAEEVDIELRTKVIQAREVKPGTFEARITPEVAKLTNSPYDDNAVLEDGTVTRSCCKNQENKK